MAENDEETIFLEPFIHQVGGQSYILSLDDSTVCKPLIGRELSFYRSMPESLKPFVPSFKGIIEVDCIEKPDGYFTLMARLPRDKLLKPNVQCFSSLSNLNKDRQSLRVPYLHSSQVDGIVEGSSSSAIVSSASRRYSLANTTCAHSPVSASAVTRQSQQQQQQEEETARVLRRDNQGSANPWLLRFASRQLCTSPVCSRVHPEHTQSKYILLANLTHDLQYPCVLDLKMGTRQYADDDPLTKQRSKEAKVASTTSASLGVRINGMQVYSTKHQKFMYHDKYYGRRLSVEGFKQALAQFLLDDSIPPVNVDPDRIALVDFLISRLQKLQQLLLQLDSFRFYTTSLLLLYDASQPFNAADIRMIDFAHATHSDLPDPSSSTNVVHTGPDSGFLFGVSSLLQILSNLRSELFKSGSVHDPNNGFSRHSF